MELTEKSVAQRIEKYLEKHLGKHCDKISVEVDFRVTVKLHKFTSTSIVSFNRIEGRTPNDALGALISRFFEELREYRANQRSDYIP